MILTHAAFNASLNATSAVLLATGYVFIRRGRVLAHKVCMVLAAGVSVAFLVSYVLYHLRVGSVPFTGQGWIRPVYFTILGTHTVLAAVIVPLVAVTLTRALRGQFERHRSIARWTLPMWFYVSVTGVVIYVLLYQVYGPATIVLR
jgi:uncharacterized membrane protein YozB (DUF420 family)